MVQPRVNPSFPTTGSGFVSQATQAIRREPHYRTSRGVSGGRDSQVMHWRLPNGSSVQMYINPENFQIRDTKQISQTRTKGGFLIQYWGENLTTITLSGTTGSSGIRGIQVLDDIYRAENRGFDLVAAQQFRRVENSINNVEPGELGRLLEDTSEEIGKQQFLLRPSLASLATNLILFYQGAQWKGFFTEFSVTESVSKLGLFDYSLTFMATEKRGRRKNFMAWHKEPTASGPTGQLLTGIGNSFRSLFGLHSQGPVAFSPFDAPRTYGGNSVENALGLVGLNEDSPSNLL